MKVRVHAADSGGCGWYRMRYPARAAKANGIDCALRNEVPGEVLHHASGAEDTWLVDDAYDADVAVFQRPLNRNRLSIIEALQRRGTAVVVDMDDDFGALPKGHPARSQTSAMFNPEVNRRWLRRACEQADLVTLSTPALAERYAPHGRFMVLPNCVPEAFLGVRAAPHAGTWVGWTGSVVTHVGDLETTGGAVADVFDDATVRPRLHVVGTGEGVAQRLGVDVDSATGWVDFKAYPRRYAELDVALVPLAANAFNRAKSALKISEAAALGVASVCSPTPDNLRMAEVIGCDVAASPEEWRSMVGRLVGDAGLRAERAAVGREAMAAWTYERRWHLWAEAWESALAFRRSARLAVA